MQKLRVIIRQKKTFSINERSEINFIVNLNVTEPTHVPLYEEFPHHIAPRKLSNSATNPKNEETAEEEAVNMNAGWR